MIEVIINETGDSAETETPAAAVRAAVTMMEDSLRGWQGEKRSASFYVDGKLSRTASLIQARGALR